MAKRVINTSTHLDLSLAENKAKLGNLENGELVVQSSKDGELKIWGKTIGGSMASLPTEEDLSKLVDEKLGDVEFDDYVKKANLNTINGQSLYNENGSVNIVIEGGSGTVDEEQLKEYAKVSDVVSNDTFNAYKVEVASSLSGKINSGDVYSKSDTDSLLASKQAIGVSYTKEEDNALLEKKADKTNTYTKTEVDELVSTLPTFSIEVVDTLPTEEISETTMYLVPTGETSEDGSLYTLNIYSKGEWKELGKQSLDFNNYYNKEDVDQLIADTLESVASDYYKKSEIDTELSDVLRVGDAVSTEDFESYKGGIYTKEEIDAIVEGVETSGGTVTDEQLVDYVKKTQLKTINGNSLLLTGEDGEDTNIVITGGDGGSDVETLKETFVEKSEYNTTISGLTNTINTKVDKSIYDARVTVVDNALNQKADTTYVTEYVQGTLASIGGYGMVVIPETVYEELIKNGQVYWNDVLLTFNENNIYMLYDETEEQEELPETTVTPDDSESGEGTDGSESGENIEESTESETPEEEV